MNCTSQNKKPGNATNAGLETTQSWSAWLPGEIRARHLPLESNATPAEVIPWVHKFLKRHVELEVAEGYESHKPWKATLDDWQQFLNRLEQLKNQPPIESIPHEKNFSPKNQPQSESPVANQPSAPENQVRTSDNEVRKGENEVIIDENILTSTENQSPQITCDPPPNTNSTKQSPSNSTPDANQENADDEEYEDEEDEEDDDEELDLADYFEDESLETALDLREYLSGRSKLDKLEPRIQEILFRLTEDHKPEYVAEVIAEPPPLGLDIQTSQAGLYRFRERYAKAREQAQKDQHNKAIQDLLAKANDTDDAFQDAAQRLIKTRLLTVGSDPKCNLQAIDSLITSLTKLRKQSLAERKQLHAEKTK